MNALRTIGAELLGLFIEDWTFALAIAAWIAIVALLATFAIGSGSLRAIVLVAGLAAILLASVFRASSSRQG